ncbi:type II secretion system minor pseudopilin GspK [Desulfolithobacter sp.]
MMRLRDRSGMALLLALFTITFLVAVTLQFNRGVTFRLQGAVHFQETTRLDTMLLGGLNIARAALLADLKQNDFDSFHDGWASLDQDELTTLFSADLFELQIQDLSGRLQVNSLARSEEQRQIWIRFLSSGKFGIDSVDEAAALVDALADWVDPDSETRDQGAENSYYAGLSPSYGCRNGPVRYPEELLLVRGMTAEILYGNDEHSGIIDYLTITGQEGTININTAADLVLRALHPEMNEETVAGLIEFRQDPDNRELLADPAWYTSVPGMAGITLLENMVTIRSSWFRIGIRARSGEIERLGSGILHRQENLSLVYWKVE